MTVRLIPRYVCLRGVTLVLLAGTLAQAGPPARRKAPAPSGRPGFCCMLLLGLGALMDPAALPAQARSNPFLEDPALNGFQALGPLCGPAAMMGHALGPCDPHYRTGIQAQALRVFADARHLFQNPEVLGPGWCLEGEAADEAKERLALTQSNQLADFDRLSAQGGALMYQLNRDAYALQSAGAGLRLGQAALQANGNHSAAAAVLGLVGDSLIAVSLELEADGDIFGEVAALSGASRAVYQRYANSQENAWLNCTGAPPGTPDSGDTALEPPMPAMATALAGLTEGCTLAARHHLILPVCERGVAEGFRARNVTISHLYRHGIACLTAGILRGRQAPCPTSPLADSRTRSDTFATFDEFAALVTAAGTRALGLGNSLFAGSRLLLIASTAANQAGSAASAADLAAASDGVALAGTSVFTQAFDLLRISALSRVWLADLIQAFNAESLDQLDDRESEAAGAPTLASSSTALANLSASPADPSTGTSSSSSSSSTAPPIPFVLAVSGTEAPAPGEEPSVILVTGLLEAPASSGPAQAVPNGAGRTQASGLWTLLRRLVPCPTRP
ncbi:hypothetical protein [Mesoterricola silvestris]|uniref:Uncharacterized protein n=1 Tax=Mesoterricola silvestris TaxID=2927979 RepID=A0AA48H6Z8_9BACT|nr:hypothetical protein [Mesoterricola silvestris]BDU72963.1 hypothetical protein METEAL_21370 [Mesoterricola silvestris]